MKQMRRRAGMRVQNKRPRAAGLAVTVLFWSMQASCIRQAPEEYHLEDAQAQKAVTIWAWDENYNIAAADEAVKSYRQRHPDVQFETVCMTQEETAARLASALVTKSRRLLPDIVLIEDYRISYFLKNYEQEFFPLNDHVSLTDFVSCKTGVNHVGDVVYGVPFDCGTAGLFYRLDLIEEAGLSESDMQELTWKEYIAAGKQVLEKTGKPMLALNPSDPALIYMMLQSAGAWFTDENGRLALKGNEALMQAAAVYKELVDAGIVLPVSDWNQFVHVFWEGKTVTVLAGCWISAGIAKAQEQKGLWRVAAVPRMQDCPESVNASLLGGSGWYVLRYGGMAQEAAQFLGETFASDTGLLNRLVEKIHLVSALKAAQACENYKKGQAFYGNQKIYEDFIRWTCRIPRIDYGADMYAMEKMMADALQDILAGGEIEKVLSDYQKKYG